MVENCNRKNISYDYIMSYAQEKQIGWLYWLWKNGASDSNFMNVANGSTFGDWANTQGADVAIKNTNSVKNTSIRAASITTGTGAIVDAIGIDGTKVKQHRFNQKLYQLKIEENQIRFEKNSIPFMNP